MAFDDAGQVTFVEHNDVGRCLSNGICHQHGLFTTQPSRIVATAPTQQDAEAKIRPLRADECGVFLYLDPVEFLYRDAMVTYAIDGHVLGLIDEETYLFLTHAPGEISISAYQLKIPLNCRAGEKLYVRAIKATDWSWDTGKDLSPVTAVEGDAAIRNRHLALPD